MQKRVVESDSTEEKGAFWSALSIIYAVLLITAPYYGLYLASEVRGPFRQVAQVAYPILGFLAAYGFVYGTLWIASKAFKARHEIAAVAVTGVVLLCGWVGFLFMPDPAAEAKARRRADALLEAQKQAVVVPVKVNAKGKRR